MAAVRKVSAEELRRRFGLDSETSVAPNPDTFAENDSLPGSRISTARKRLRDSVALVGAFDSAMLPQNRSPRAGGEIAEFIAGDCEPVTTPSGLHWRLTLPVRKAVIDAAAPSRLNDLVKAGRKIIGTHALGIDPLLDAAERIVGNAFDDIPHMSLIESRALIAAASWFPADVRTPDQDILTGRIAVLEQLEPLRILVKDGFVGRRRELRRLRNHILVDEDPGVLALTGPGGVGKSSLLAQAVLAANDESRPPLVAYLTFDRPELRADQPLTLIAEAARQLSAVVSDDSRALALKIERQSHDSNRRATSALVSRSSVGSSTRTAKRDSTKDLFKLAWQYAQILDHTYPERRILWVLDTFEVAQRVGEVAVAGAFDLIDVLRSKLGDRLRVLIAGRGDVGGDRVQRMHLEGLDRPTARTLLRREVSGLALNRKFLDAVLDQIGTNPLSVRLAGELLRREGREGLHTAEVQRRLLFRVGSEEIQGVLYKRILDHLDDEDVQRIANPGLVVRRIDAGIIRQVLAAPCGLGDLSLEAANDLLERLGREASLVEPAGVGVFVHRSDVRAIMLPLIEREDMTRATSIRRAAVLYHANRYAQSKDLIDKTEELYHRLMLGESAKELTAVWDRDAAVLLQPALDEFPPASQAYLAERLGWTVDPEVFRAAEDESWAEQAARLCRQRLDTGDATGALALARERSSDQVRSLMDPIIIEAMATLGRWNDALGQAERTLQWATRKGEWQTYVAVSVMAARIAEDAAQWDQALTLLRDARDVTQDYSDIVMHLAAGVAMLRIQRRAGRTLTPADADFRATVLAEGRALSETDRRLNPTLIRDMAAEFGSEAMDLVSAATQLVGVDLGSEAGDQLIGSLSSEDRSSFNIFYSTPDSRDTLSESGDAVAPTPSSDSGDNLDWLRSGTSVEQSNRVNEYLGNISGTSEEGEWSDAIASAFRVESDDSAY
ncbi:hypothetical protein Mycch_2969 [Mycolicibacterium chubuense NBB4]|uniref:Orc1-like AAA ATPase domain-containing protein n=1 Tax=Mycolicibacterium chubuense (strain NBB4) TaxID=710421 RepID=I4BKB6_MYCCN|nr:AAA family ATPase [Mycolicibacterium chubuense]AFM17723.1 hypothetical protein Mycch_2969 [Mycolicibacterium chubuense NBB4]